MLFSSYRSSQRHSEQPSRQWHVTWHGLCRLDGIYIYLVYSGPVDKNAGTVEQATSPSLFLPELS